MAGRVLGGLDGEGDFIDERGSGLQGEVRSDR